MGMNLKINKSEFTEIEFCKLNIKYEIDKEYVEDKKNEVALKFKNHKIPGFRSGRASQDILKQFFKKEIDSVLKNELTEEVYNDVINEKNIKPFGRPNFTSINLNSNFDCEFVLHTKPDFELSEYKSFEIPKPKNILSDEDFAAKMIQELRRRYGESLPFSENDFVQENDSVIINYEGFIDDQKIESLTKEGELLSISIDDDLGFSNNILGMKINETREFILNMPENMKDKEISGKSVKFSVFLVMGSKTNLAPLDDELAKKMQMDSLDELIKSVNTMSANKGKTYAESALTDQVSRRLVANHKFNIPEWLTNAEAQASVKNGNGNWDAMTDEEKNDFVKSTEDNVKLSLILDKIRENEPDAQLTDEEVLSTIKTNLQQTNPNRPAEEIMREILKNGHMPLLFSRVKDEHTLKFILNTCTITE